MYAIGSIICIRHFLENKPDGDKLFIVMGCIDGTLNLMAITTSKMYFDKALFKYGVIRDRANSFYGIPAHRVIGKNGWSFNLDTVFSLQSKLIRFNADRLSQYDIDVYDVLKDEEFQELLRFYLTQSAIGDKKYLESLLVQ